MTVNQPSSPAQVPRSDTRGNPRKLYILVFLGMAAVGYYYSWWWQAWVESSSIGLWLAFFFASFYILSQIVGGWLIYLFARSPLPPLPPPKDLTVDVFVTTCNEPYEVVERTLTAASKMQGDYTLWLLDDGNDPALAYLARKLGARYLTRFGKKDAKAGNINEALARTNGDIIAIFDIDHAPEPDFLTKTLGHFNDPHMGFVQVMLTFGNQRESWIARAAAETSYDFYNPVSIGMDAVGGASMMGSNSLIRRQALKSIGGYQPGLAEDLATSLALHAAGWRSAYVAEPLAPGLAPPDLTAWFTQQFKWARGVFELLLTAFPRLFMRLTWGQRLSYPNRMTKYLVGPVVSIHLVLTISALFLGSSIGNGFHHYLLHFFPVAILDILIKQVAIGTWRHPSIQATSLWSAVTLVSTTWPIYTLAWIMALLRLPLRFRPTPKKAIGGFNPIWLAPQSATLLFLSIGIILFLLINSGAFSIWILLFAVTLLIPHLMLFYQIARTHHANVLVKIFNILSSN
jgi:cellulose synthase (UDP-forming)